MGTVTATETIRLTRTIPDSYLEGISGRHLSTVELGMLASQVLDHNSVDRHLGNYRVEQSHRSSGHREGDGGEREFVSKLISPAGEDVLMSVEFLAYGTYGDDSMDYDYPVQRGIYLLSEDAVARMILDSIRNPVKECAVQTSPTCAG